MTHTIIYILIYILIGIAVCIGVFILGLHMDNVRNKTVEADEDGDNIDGGA